MLILGISGRKQSGKSTVGNFILSLFLAQLDYAEKIYMDDDGQLIVSDILGDTRYEGIFNIYHILNKHNDPRIAQAIDKLNKKIKIYNFADILKTDICMNILGLTYDQCYGDDQAKNSLTQLKWKDMPCFDEAWTQNEDYDNSGYMTARQVMQFVGTDIFRKMYADVWIVSTINKILKEKPTVAIITDCRFPNEVDAIKQMDGKVWRLTRNPFNSSHISETILDQSNYDWSNFDAIIDNSTTTLLEQFTTVKTKLEEILPL
jgi:hypothetical protein